MRDSVFAFVSLSIYLSSANMDMMYEPHLANHHHHQHNGESQESGSLLEELDKIAPIQSFDAFPKVRHLYTFQLINLGPIDICLAITPGWYTHRYRVSDMPRPGLGEPHIVLLAEHSQNDLGDYLYGPPDYAFQVDHGLERELQLNVDLTVAMPCHCGLLIHTRAHASPLHRS